MKTFLKCLTHIYTFLYSVFILLMFFSGEEHFTECLNLINEFKLYTEALKLYQPESKEYKVCVNRFIEHQHFPF